MHESPRIIKLEQTREQKAAERERSKQERADKASNRVKNARALGATGRDLFKRGFNSLKEKAGGFTGQAKDLGENLATLAKSKAITGFEATKQFGQQVKENVQQAPEKILTAPERIGDWLDDQKETVDNAIIDVRVGVAKKRQEASDWWSEKSGKAVGWYESKIDNMRAGLAKKRAEKALEKARQNIQVRDQIKNATDKEVARYLKLAQEAQARGDMLIKEQESLAVGSMKEMRQAEAHAKELHQEAQERRNNGKMLGGLRHTIANFIQ